jgi:hypothetical protein
MSSSSLAPLPNRVPNRAALASAETDDPTAHPRVVTQRYVLDGGLRGEEYDYRHAPCVLSAQADASPLSVSVSVSVALALADAPWMSSSLKGRGGRCAYVPHM